jgi:magnesium transporter
MAKVIWKETKVSSLLALCLGAGICQSAVLSWETEIPAEYSACQSGVCDFTALSLQVIRQR